MDINSIEQRPRYFADVPFDLLEGAVAGTAGIGSESAGARVQRGHQHEIGGEGGRLKRAADCHDTVFERLTEHFERASIELRKFIEEQNPVATVAL